MKKMTKDYALTDEQRKLTEENHNLIYKYLSQNKLDEDEYYDILAIALCWAAATYNSNSYSFSTYAFSCFRNAYLDEYRKQMRTVQRTNGIVMSLNSDQAENYDGQDFCLQDCITDTCDLEELIFNKMYVDRILSILKEREKYVLEMWASGSTLKEIGDSLGITKEYARIIKNKAIRKIESKNCRLLNMSVPVWL